MTLHERHEIINDVIRMLKEIEEMDKKKNREITPDSLVTSSNAKT
jgi:hypothetical protein